MRRAVSSFTVEVRRRPRLAITSNPHVQSSETKSPQAGFDRESHRVTTAAFAAKNTDPSPVAVGSSPRGRILPSLVPDESLRRTLRDAAPTAAESDPPSRAPKRRDQASKSPRNSGFSSAANAPLADGLSPKSRQPSNVQSDEGAGVSPRVETTEQSQVVGTIVHRKVESEPSWLATSSAMNSNPASVGSGGCSRCDEAPLSKLLLRSRSPIRRIASRRH